jgi:amidase
MARRGRPGRDFEAFGRHLAAFFTATAPGGDVDALAKLREAPDRTRARQAWARYFENVDVFLCPIAPTTAPEHDDRPFTERTIETTNGPVPYSRVPFWISHATLSGLPAAAVPVGTTASTGLPVAIQIIGAQHEGNTVLAFAECLNAMIGAQ